MQPDDELSRDMARAIGLGAIGAYGRILMAVFVGAAVFFWMFGASCSSSDDVADRLVEEAGKRQVAAALAQHQQSVKAFAAVKDAEDARAAAAAAVQAAEASRENARIVDDTTVAVRDPLEGLPTHVTVPVQITQRMRSDSLAIVKLKIAVVKDSIAIAELTATIAADSAVKAAQRDEIEGWKLRKDPPRCGAKCGAAIAVGGIVVTALVVNTVRNALRVR